MPAHAAICERALANRALFPPGPDSFPEAFQEFLRGNSVPSSVLSSVLSMEKLQGCR
jgi:hypothetical protein